MLDILVARPPSITLILSSNFLAMHFGLIICDSLLQICFIVLCLLAGACLDNYIRCMLMHG